MSASDPQFFVGYSLVDITATGVIRSDDAFDVGRNQQRNWETVLQCIGLKTQPLHIQLPQVIEDSVDAYRFGEFYSGKHRIWQWSWAIEAEGVYDLPGKPLAALNTDFEQVPIITNLTETARFMLPIFHPYGAIKNIFIETWPK